MAEPKHRLDFGTLDLVGRDARGGVAYWFETLAEGYALGSPEATKVIVESLLRDGDDSRITRYGNRTITFQVVINAASAIGLGDGEAALAMQVGGRNELAWTPPDGYVQTKTIFTVLNSQMQYVPDDTTSEVLGPVHSRTYSLTLECEPFGRSASAITSSFALSAATVTTVDDGTSLTGWTLGPSPMDPSMALDTFGGVSCIKLTIANGPTYISNVGVTANRAGTISGNYIGIDVAWATSIYLNVNSGRTVSPVAVVPVDTFYRRFWFLNPGGSSYDITAYQDAGPAGGSVYIDKIVSSANIDSAAASVVSVKGSARTQAAITLAKSTSTLLTSAIIYTDPALLTHGYHPAVQASWALAPQGTYVLYASGFGLSPDTQYTTTISDSKSRLQTVVIRSSRNTPFVPMGEFYLGGFQDGRLGALTVSILNEGGFAVNSPTLHLFRKDDDTALTFVDGFSASSLSLETPTTKQPFGGLWADGVSVLDKVTSLENPVIAPPLAPFVFITNAPTTQSVTYYPRWHTFAGSD